MRSVEACLSSFSFIFPEISAVGDVVVVVVVVVLELMLLPMVY